MAGRARLDFTLQPFTTLGDRRTALEAEAAVVAAVRGAGDVRARYEDARQRFQVYVGTLPRPANFTTTTARPDASSLAGAPPPCLGSPVPNAQYWTALVLVAVAGLAVRVTHGEVLLRQRAAPLGRLDLAVVLVALLALGFHCAAMFFRSVVAAITGADDAIVAVSELGTASQVAYWVPAGLLLIALRRAWAPLLIAEGGVLLAVGATMFWDFGLRAHLVAIAGAVAVTTAVLATTTARVTGHRISE